MGEVVHMKTRIDHLLYGNQDKLQKLIGLLRYAGLDHEMICKLKHVPTGSDA